MIFEVKLGNNGENLEKMLIKSKIINEVSCC